MSGLAAHLQPTPEAVWRYILNRKCKVNGESRSGVYGRTLISAYAAVASEFKVTIQELKKILSRLKGTGKWVKYEAQRLFAGKLRPKKVRPPRQDRQPSRRELRANARQGGFMIRRS